MVSETFEASTVPTQFVDLADRRLAYRVVGNGPALILCNRFRGNLDTWDPLFLEELGEAFRVYYFDYSSFGRSTGEPPRTLSAMVDDLRAFADALNLQRFVLCGWSIGGLAVQAALAILPERISHLIILGSNPPGKLPLPPEPLFLETALHNVNDLRDEQILFFEPASQTSLQASVDSHNRIAQRKDDLDLPLTPDQFTPFLKAISQDRQSEEHYNYREALEMSKPILAICGDHDISFPVENWYAFSRKFNVVLSVFPQSGHAVHHQFPELVAGLIKTFVGSE